MTGSAGFPVARRALLASLAATALASAGAARAETLAVLAVAPPPGPGPALADLAVRLRQHVAEYRAGTLDARELRERMTGAAGGAALAELERGTEAARLAYLNGQYDRSLAILRSIADDVEKLPDGPDAFSLWTKVMTRLARTELDLGRPAAARAWIERLVHAAPDAPFDPTLHPARLVEEVEKARAALKAEPTATLAVTSAAPGATVYVNGREIGIAPVRLALARGRYRVSGARGGARIGPIAADVREENLEITLDFAVPEALRPEMGPGLAFAAGQDLPGNVCAAGVHLGLDRIVVVGIEEEGGGSYAVGSLYEVRRGVLEREGRVRLANGALPPGGVAALAEFLVTGRDASRLVESSREPRPMVPVPGSAEADPSGPPRPAALVAPAADAGRGPVALGLRLGYMKATGNVGYHVNMEEWINSAVPLQLDFLANVSRRVSVGAYGSYGWGRGGAEVARWCDRPNASCMLQVIRAGVEVEYDLAPGAMAPWFAAGAGYEWNAFHTEDGSGQGAGEILYGGVEVNLQGGAEWRVAPSFSLGPFVMLTGGRYDREVVRTGTAVDLRDEIEAVTHKSLHFWNQVGVRGRFDF